VGIVIEVKGLGLRYDEHVLKTRAWSWNKKQACLGYGYCDKVESLG
jgi:hypothetical protein